MGLFSPIGWVLERPVFAEQYWSFSGTSHCSLPWCRLLSCSLQGAIMHAQIYQCKRENDRETEERLADEHKLKKRPFICQLSLLEQGKGKGGTSRNVITYLPAEINYKVLSVADSSEARRKAAKWEVAALQVRWLLNPCFLNLSSLYSTLP